MVDYAFGSNPPYGGGHGSSIMTAAKRVNVRLNRSPLRLIRVVLTVAQPLPACPEQRTSSGRPGWSGSCQKGKSRAAVKESAAQGPAYLRQPTSGGLERRPARG